ncbi:class I SAM-dependent methyltransferase [Lentzea sp.]|uniref:class I SAM-dependent methyltransferase n=1 Tax=Lentzea sp. TaxID=56099 RepID=UPI002C1035C6|nr:class I SAM-dependent methyltransferase [Lentzea sp.]HUQ55153.1 class I SAM-dependent methyltransferase [Lentzea sp.]
MTDGEPGSCLLCMARSLDEVITLRPTPPANALAATADEAQAAATYPLRLSRCRECGLVQLADRISRDLLFRDYKYATGAAPGLVRHFGALAAYLIARHAIPPGSAIVEVGSNDGTLLRAFADQGMRVLGVDPAVELARQATESGIPTYPEHFDERVAERVMAEFGPADIVLANNVLAHVSDLNSTLRGVRALLMPTSHGVFEAAHLLPMVTEGMYEFIYHEHVAYFSLRTMRSAVNRHGMEVVDVEEVPTQGGSIRCWVKLADGLTQADISPRVTDLLRREDDAGLTDGSLLRRFAARVSRVNTMLCDVVGSLHASGKRICGYGASARAVTLMSQAGIGHAVNWIADDNPKKIGLYVPGSGIPIRPPSELTPDESDYCVLFAWNFSADITAKTVDFTGGGGMFIVPFPELTVR